MKKLLFFVILSLAFICCDELPEQYRADRYTIEKFSFEDHDYLMFERDGKYGCTVIHDPNCKKCSNIKIH